MQSKFSFLFGIVLSMTSALTAFCADDVPTGYEVRKVFTASKSGAILGAFVSMQRNDVSSIARSFRDAASQGDSIQLSALAILYAIIDSDTSSSQGLHKFATEAPSTSISLFYLATESLKAHQWAEAHAYFTRLQQIDGRFTQNFSESLMALTWYAGGERTKALMLLKKKAYTREGLLPRMLLLRLLLADNPADPRIAALFLRDDMRMMHAPPAVQVWFIQLKAAWLNANAQRDKADALLRRARARTDLHFLAVQLKPNDFDLRPSIDELAAEQIFLFGLALRDARIFAEQQAKLGEKPLTDHQKWIAQRVDYAYLARVLYLAPDFTLARLEMARLARRGLEVGDVDKILTPVTSDDPFLVAVAMERWMSAADRGDNVAALVSLDTLISAFPDDAAFLQFRGMTEMALSRYPAAKKDFDRALHMRVSPGFDQGRTYFVRGQAREAMGDLHGAFQDYDLALQYGREDPGILNDVGYRLLLSGRQGGHDVVALLKHAHDLAPDEAATCDSYGWALITLRGDAAAALPLLTKAVENRPNDPELAYHLGVAYWYSGMKSEAVTEWQRAQGKNPGVAISEALATALRKGPPSPGSIGSISRSEGKDFSQSSGKVN